MCVSVCAGQCACPTYSRDVTDCLSFRLPHLSPPALQLFIIQSTKFPAAHLDSAVEAFLESFSARLDGLSQEEFDEQVCFYYFV